MLTRLLAADLIGFVASGLVVATFCMNSMSALRGTAIASNLAFMSYAYLCDLTPVLALHAVLLPVNIYRLVRDTRERTRDSAGFLGHAGLADPGVRDRAVD